MPSEPDVHLSDIKPRRCVGPGHSPSFTRHRYSAFLDPPQRDRNLRKAPLKLRGRRYAKGMGVHAPNQLVYDIQPEHKRFVALAGVDEQLVESNNGTNLAMHPSVVFRIFIDGKFVTESPVMRIQVEPWRFSVPIPAGAKIISLAVTDAGNGNREDLANWVNAGFVFEK